MDKFISMLCTGEFWIAITFAFVVSFILATIVQDIYDTLMDIRYAEDDDEYEVSDEQLHIGCTVYDIISERAGIYCGTDDDSNAVVIQAQDNSIYVFKAELNALLTLKQQE